MNLFLLHDLPKLAANLHCDKHVVKMILETTQLLYTAWWTGREAEDIDWAPCEYAPYRPTHRNHPSAVWVRERAEHYNWALHMGMWLCVVYAQRYGRRHKCEAHLRRLRAMGYPAVTKADAELDKSKYKVATVGVPVGCQHFYCAIADDVYETCRVVDSKGRVDAIATYRQYYRYKRGVMDMKWRKGKVVPKFML